MMESIICLCLRLVRRFVEMTGSDVRQLHAQQDVLLTGTFHSSNWIHAHLQPMAMSGVFFRIRVVTTSNVSFPDGIEVIRPSTQLARIIGSTGARLLTFATLAVIQRPTWIGGFHLLFNGMLAILLGRVLRIGSLYFCVGGPAEVKDGGLLSENRLLARLPGPSPRIEAELLRIAGMASMCICMGQGAAKFLEARAGVRTVVNPGGVTAERLDLAKDFDLIFLGRLAPIKNLFELIRAVELLNRERRFTLAIVGAGELDSALREEARRLQIDHVIEFPGLQSVTSPWLARSRIFVLPSISEGLSLSLMEALAAGLPAVVSRVGDLGDLVEEDYNGYLLDKADARGIAEAVKLCLEPANYNRLRENALHSARAVTLEAAAVRWQNAINGDRKTCAASPVA